MTTKLRVWGNSEAVRIPKELLKAFRLKEGSLLEFEKTKRGILIKPKHKRETLEDLLRNYDPKTEHELVDWGPDVGKEIIE